MMTFGELTKVLDVKNIYGVVLDGTFFENICFIDGHFSHFYVKSVNVLEDKRITVTLIDLR